jgi:hypothetical protein
MNAIQRKAYMNERLVDGSEIPASKHREVELMILDTLEALETTIATLSETVAELSPLAKGTYILGDLPSVDSVFTVTFPDVGTSDYMVAVYPVSKSSNYDLDNDVFFMTREHTATSFKICGREIANQTQNISLDWEIKKK